MASIKIEDIVDNTLDSEFKAALEAAVKAVIPTAVFDKNSLFKAFAKAVRQKCNTWEEIPDKYIKQ